MPQQSCVWQVEVITLHCETWHYAKVSSKFHAPNDFNPRCSRKYHQYIADETAINRNPPIHSFTGDRRNLTEDQHLSMLYFYKNIGRRNIFCGHNFLTEGVFVTQLNSESRISVWWTVGIMKTNSCFTSSMLYKIWDWVASTRNETWIVQLLLLLSFKCLKKSQANLTTFPVFKHHAMQLHILKR